MRKTKYAAAERSKIEEIWTDYESLKKIKPINDLLNAMPNLAAILNANRQIVFANTTLFNQWGNITLEDILGKRPGEAVYCVNAANDTGGCGTSDNCRYCGAINAILESQRKETTAIHECRIVSEKSNEPISYDLRVTAYPWKINNQTYTILFLDDISDIKRKMALESIFFHDILNKAGSLTGLFDLVLSSDENRINEELIQLAKQISDDLIEEILTQKQLLAAENNNLKVNLSPIDSNNLLHSLKNQMERQYYAAQKNLEIDNQNCQMQIETDVVLLKRILTNMIKNALEATENEGIVKIGCKSEVGFITFWVNNPGEMEPHVKAQIFQRSFTTKGKNRGLGTYSMKLLGEKYLKGKVYFTSVQKDGTTFYVQLPF